MTIIKFMFEEKCSCSTLNKIFYNLKDFARLKNCTNIFLKKSIIFSPIPLKIEMNSTGPPNADISNNIILAATIGSAMELFLVHPMAVILSIFNISLILNTKLLHTNLKIILLTQSATIVSVF